ncbi:hypothetical protein OC861_002210 [Tilletia horrida]|nr:hypothetical protein OC845_002044 [Tilletia horrida]KAK0568191.1 hypothetical protein OC861_002210 [Tilletia horrida]
MPRPLVDVRAANLRAAAALTAASPAFIPLAVLLGGTSGIGLHTAYSLNSAFKGRVHLIFSSRSAARGNEAISALPYPPSAENGGSAEFISVDAFSMAGIRELGKKIQQRAEEKSGGKVNYLVLSCGQLVMQGSDRTEEGIERKLAGNFYSRFALAEILSPNLEAATKAGEPARVISVLAPGRGGPIDTNDFGLAKEAQVSGRGMLHLARWLRQAEMAGVTYGDWMTEKMAQLYPSVSWFHTYPGIVKTGVLQQFPLIFRVLAKPLFWVAGISAEESGENHAALLLDEQYKDGGAFFKGPHGEDIQKTQIKGLEGEVRQEKINELRQHLLSSAGLPA